MVKTGARAKALEQLLMRMGYAPVALPSPRPPDLPRDRLAQILDLSRALGGRAASPQLRPGALDLVFRGGLVVELDEELHFNRYRRLTLEPSWAASPARVAGIGAITRPAATVTDAALAHPTAAGQGGGRAPAAGADRAALVVRCHRFMPAAHAAICRSSRHLRPAEVVPGG